MSTRRSSASWRATCSSTPTSSSWAYFVFTSYHNTNYLFLPRVQEGHRRLSTASPHVPSIQPELGVAPAPSPGRPIPLASKAATAPCAGTSLSVVDMGDVDFTFDFDYNIHKEMASAPAAYNMAEHGEFWDGNQMPMQVDRIGIQMVVGDVGSVGDEKPDINKFAMEFGYRESPEQEQDAERGGGSKTTASDSSGSDPSRVAKKQKRDGGDGLPTPRKLFSEDDELISADEMREMQRAPQPVPPPQPAAARPEAPQWLTHTWNGFSRGKDSDCRASSRSRASGSPCSRTRSAHKTQDAVLGRDVRAEVYPRRRGREQEEGQRCPKTQREDRQHRRGQELRDAQAACREG